MDVNPLANYVRIIRFRHYLLPVLIGCMLLVQACPAYLSIVMNPATSHINLGDSVTIKGHMYDDDNPGVAIPHIPVQVVVASDSGFSHNLNYNTDSSGWITFVYTPQKTGNFTFDLYSSVNYSTVQGLPATGIHQAHGHANVVHVHPKVVYHPVPSIAPAIIFTTNTATTVPVITTQTIQQTIMETQVTQSTQATQVPQTSRVTPSPQATYTVPALTTGIPLEVTSPTITGAAPTGTTGMADTLPAETPAPTATGSPSSIWPAALIIIIILAVIGSALFLISRQKEELKK